jgi:hypothetical protein
MVRAARVVTDRDATTASILTDCRTILERYMLTITELRQLQRIEKVYAATSTQEMAKAARNVPTIKIREDDHVTRQLEQIYGRWDVL